MPHHREDTQGDITIAGPASSLSWWFDFANGMTKLTHPSGAGIVPVTVTNT